MRGLAGRALALLVAYAATYAVLQVLDFEPHALPLLLLLVLAALVWRLVHEALDAPPADWGTPVPPSTRPVGQDAVLAANLRLLESHTASRAPDPALGRRLLSLGGARLEARLGVPADGATSDARLGPEWAALRRDPGRRLSVAEIDRVLTRIEEL